MSNATKCDRCGACYEYGGMTVGEEYDLCDGCVADFEAWMECQPVTGAPERVTESAEMSHDTREKLEADVRRKQREWSQSPCALNTNVYEVIGWLDRQAAITEREFFETACHGCERLGGDGRTTLDELSDELRKYIVKADRLGAALDERDDQLADARESLEAAWDDNAELRAKLDAEAQHAREAWQLWGEADARAEQAETERDEWKTKCETREFAYKQADAERKRYSEQIDELRAEIATLKEHRAGNMERLDFCRCADQKKLMNLKSFLCQQLF